MVECPCGLHRPERLPIRRLGGLGVLVPRPDRQRGPGQTAERAAGAEGPLQPRNRLSGESWLSGRDPGDAAMGLPATIAEMNWNDAAEDMLQQIVAQTPRPWRRTRARTVFAWSRSSPPGSPTRPKPFARPCRARWSGLGWTRPSTSTCYDGSGIRGPPQVQETAVLPQRVGWFRNLAERGGFEPRSEE